MAVLPVLPGLEVEVVVNGEPVREYDDDDTMPDNTVSKHVEATSGGKFQASEPEAVLRFQHGKSYYHVVGNHFLFTRPLISQGSSSNNSQNIGARFKLSGIIGLYGFRFWVEN
ncbi:hypothetical protein BCR34DRAFT_588098 [Clohesyomyces aquaticus]|uniref:DUF7918 domain-containing protein n=1 Tax=Clohesyomyces aquaticus TaxID=1231657 RepID=A0A1Y1ZLF9_9PLEO|nr:hypothetical protein BCR34DRAFT_588098 [Clohesyomyces aquaticus]